jgi:hypothetical protein
MARNPHSQSKKAGVEKKYIRQKRDQRKLNLEKKSHKYRELYGADICLGIRIQDSGQIYIFSADHSGFWSFLGCKLVFHSERLLCRHRMDSPY